MILNLFFFFKKKIRLSIFQKEYPELEDEELYRHARLVTSAVIAKVHTIDWTVQLLKTDTMLAGMRANWLVFISLYISIVLSLRMNKIKINLYDELTGMDY